MDKLKRVAADLLPLIRILSVLLFLDGMREDICIYTCTLHLPKLRESVDTI